MTSPPDTTFTPSSLRRLFYSLLFVAAGIAVLGAIVSSRATGQEGPDATANKIEPWVIAHTANGQQAESLIRPTCALRRL